MAELIYKRAGHFELFRYSDGARFLFTGIVNSIASSITRNTTQVSDGNSDFDHTFSNGAVGQATINLNSFVPTLYGALTSMTTTTGQSVTVRRIEEITVPSASPYTVTLKGTPAANSTSVVDENNEELTSVEVAPATADEYQVTTNTLTFHSGAAGKSMVVAYDVATTGTQMSLPSESNNEVYRLTIAGQAVLKTNEGVAKSDALTIDRVMVSGEIPMPTRQKEPQGWSFTLNVLPPRPGYKVVDYVVEE